MTSTLAIIGCVLACVLGCPTTYAAESQEPEPGGSPESPKPAAKPKRHGYASIVSEHTSVQPGRTAQLGLLFVMDEGWHIYWNGYTTSGTAPTVEWTVPEGVTVSELRWPAPQRYLPDPDILDLVYENRVLLPFTVTVPETIDSDSRLKIRAKVEYLICQDACIGEKSDVELSIPVSAAIPRVNRETAKDFAASQGRMPRPFPTDSSVKIGWAKTAAIVQAPQALTLAFYPGKDCVELLDPRLTTAKSDRLTLRLAPGAEITAPLSGILEVQAPNGSYEFFQIQSSRPVTAENQPPSGPDRPVGSQRDTVDPNR